MRFSYRGFTVLPKYSNFLFWFVTVGDISATIFKSFLRRESKIGERFRPLILVPLQSNSSLVMSPTLTSDYQNVSFLPLLLYSPNYWQ